MMPLSFSHRNLTFALLYFAQGAVMAYFTALNSLYLLSFNLSMQQIGIIGAIAMIPFILKIFLGMISDRFNFFSLGYRKPYILIGLMVQCLCLILVPFINPGTQFWLFALFAFLTMTGMALYDTATDGLALDTTPLEEQGVIQGFMVGGRAAGVVIVSATIGLLADNASWHMAFWLLAVLSLAPMLLVTKMDEFNHKAGQNFEWKAFTAFNNRSILSLAGLGILYSFVIYGANQIVNPYLQKVFNISITSAGFLTTLWGIGVIIGGLLCGWLTKTFGQQRSVQFAVVMSLASILALAVAFNPILAWSMVVIFGIAFGFYETVYFALCMQRTDPRIAASMYSILIAVANIGTGVSMAVVGGLVDSVGFSFTFIFLAASNLIAIPLIGAIFSSKSHPQTSPLIEE